MKKIFLGILCCCVFVLGYPKQGFTTSEQQLFVVEALLVDVQDTDATAARNKAFNEAQVQGFYTLVDRLLQKTEAQKLTEISEQDIFHAVKDISVSNERHSSDRYQASFDIRFDPDRIKELFEQKTASFSALESRPILVLPIFKEASGHYVLWEDSNAWRAAWDRYQQPRSGVMPVTLPLGDLEDTKDIDPVALSLSAPMSVDGLKGRYAVKDIYALIAEENTGENPGKQVIRVMQFFGNLPVEVQTIIVSSSFDQAVTETHQFLQEQWKEQVQVSMSVTGEVRARVFFSSLRDWLDVQKTVQEMASVQHIDVTLLTQAYADVTLNYAGDIQTLFTSMEQAGLFLSRAALLDGDLYVLKRL